VRTSERHSLGLAIRRADRRVYAKVAVVAGVGVWFGFAGPFAIVSVLADLRSEPAAWPIVDGTPEAKVVKDQKS
jgi:hypothetical protein